MRHTLYLGGGKGGAPVYDTSHHAFVHTNTHDVCCLPTQLQSEMMIADGAVHVTTACRGVFPTSFSHAMVPAEYCSDAVHGTVSLYADNTHSLVL